jgi:hypothetical protein
MVGTRSLQRREGESCFTCPLKTSRWKLASKNRNIQNLKYSRYRENQTLLFEKPDCLIFHGLVRCVVYEDIVFHSSHLSF